MIDCIPPHGTVFAHFISFCFIISLPYQSAIRAMSCHLGYVLDFISISVKSLQMSAFPGAFAVVGQHFFGHAKLRQIEVRPQRGGRRQSAPSPTDESGAGTLLRWQQGEDVRLTFRLKKKTVECNSYKTPLYRYIRQGNINRHKHLLFEREGKTSIKQ